MMGSRKPTRALEIAAAFALDAVLGDPEFYPHPVRIMGRAINTLEEAAGRVADDANAELAAGAVITGMLVAGSYTVARLLGGGGRRRAVRETLVLYTCLARKDLARSALRVAMALEAGDLKAARSAARCLVGRDPERLDAAALSRASVESLAENLVDGVLSPLFWAALGGAPAGMAFKAASTLDSMIGHRGAPYEYLGRAAARLDDLANLLAARLSIPLISLAALLARQDAVGALRVSMRDRRRHPSPNSAHAEAAFAGALGLKLGGSDTYGGRLRLLASIGDGACPRGPEDIRAAVSLMNASSLLGLGLAIAAAACFGRERS